MRETSDGRASEQGDIRRVECRWLGFVWVGKDAAMSGGKR